MAVIYISTDSALSRVIIFVSTSEFCCRSGIIFTETSALLYNVIFIRTDIAFSALETSICLMGYISLLTYLAIIISLS